MRARLSGERFDVAIIGGGINGVAIARECARAGKRTLLVEQNDFASGTTSRSTRIIHGGLRYLEHGELGLVRESLKERERMLADYPHLVRPLRFVLAIPKASRHNALAIRTGLLLYRKLAGARCLPALAQFDAHLDRPDLATFDYDDAQCEFPERLVAEWLGEAIAAGAVVRNHCTALGLTKNDGRVTGLVIHDTLTGTEARVEAAHVINATGPWADMVCAQSGVETKEKLLGGIRGSHIVLPRFPGAPGSAVYSEAPDGRPVFLIPWNDQLLVGTTEVPDSADPARAEPSPEEVGYLLDSVNHLYPAANIGAGDILYAFAGVRPLPYSPTAKPAAITRRHRIHDHSDDGARGLYSVIGGKLTTAAALAREVARKLGAHVPEPQTALIAPAPADGIEVTLRQWARQISAVAHIPEHSARAVAEWHGRRAMCVARMAGTDDALRHPLCPHSSHIVAEAVEVARYECAVTLGDILLRRVPVALSGCWSKQCTRAAAQRIGWALGWDQLRIGREAELFDAERAAFLKKPSGLSRPQRAA
ncbi:MAG: glycerol-3-phosphate dehydrogenase/oxidase [Candidatus Koribacter versatilis]|uniref:Glycerol-3-phosphate dehydrogenase/oxidase n=1 Tax=Candidatus Korobacter versatilis TaxID=658062 RepID=A0A932A8P4_9BACT|nr:glycerol-3-phosphate dehydrogenase/oxidase [Candidatus Koribacter versatilis]